MNKIDWLRKHALFACQEQVCAQEVSYPYEDLRMWQDKPICVECYTHVQATEDGEDLLWCDLPQFDPFEGLEERP